VEPRCDRALTALRGIIIGKERALRLAVCCLLARGHLLIEDLPGVGKTTMAAALARCFGLAMHRIQFTSDLLPADIIGSAVFDREARAFTFHPGPVFAQMVLADELNRASPRTQSALLEAMEERRVSVEGTGHPLPEPFFVIATQNPSHQTGTFPLPESQLDRFLMRIELGHPDREAEREMLSGPPRRELIERLAPVSSPAELIAAQVAAEQVHVSDALRSYLLDMLEHSRADGQHGLSPRAGLDLQRAARAWAWMEERTYVVPEDVQAVAPAVMGHRLGGWGGGDTHDGLARAQRLVAAVAVG
jgi:MoxR-like ATPase